MTTPTLTETDSPKTRTNIITTANLIERAKACVETGLMCRIRSTWVRGEIELAVATERAGTNLRKALLIAEPTLEFEANVALYNDCRLDLIERANTLADSIYWRDLKENFKTRLIIRVAGEKFGPKNIQEVIQAIETLERVIRRKQDEDNKRLQSNLDLMHERTTRTTDRRRS